MVEDVDKSFKSLTGIPFKEVALHPLAAGSAIGMGTLSAKTQRAGAKTLTTKTGKKLKAIPQITRPSKQAATGTGRGTNLAMQAMDADVPGKVLRQLSDPTSGTRRAGSLASAYASSRGWIGKSMTDNNKERVVMDIGRSAFGVDHISKSSIRINGEMITKPISAMSRAERKAVKRTVMHHKNARTQGRIPNRSATRNTAEFTNDYLDNLNRVKEHRLAQSPRGDFRADPAPGYAPPRTKTKLTAHEEVAPMRSHMKTQANRRARFEYRNRPDVAGPRRERGYQRGLQKEYDNVHLGSWQKKMYTILPPTMVGSGALAMGKDKELLKKSDTKQNAETAGRTASGAVAGGTAGYLASSIGGYAAKKTLAYRRKKALEKPGPYRGHYGHEWGKFKAQEGFKHMSDLKNNFERADVMSRYPKTLKDWRGQRALAFKNKPVPYATLIAAPAVAGGVMAYKKNKQQKA